MEIVNKIGQYLQQGRAWYTRDVKNIKVFSVHHTASLIDNKTDDQILQELMNVHVQEGWPGLSYHFVIIRGKIYQINQFDWVTWVDSVNWDCLGIVVAGYFHEPYNQAPSKEDKAALAWLLTELSTSHPEFPATQKDTYGHRERFATACPGDNLFPYVLEYRSKLGIVDWANPDQQQAVNPDTIIPGKAYTQDELPAELFNVSDGQQVAYSGAQYIAKVNDNGTRTFLTAPNPVEQQPQDQQVEPQQPVETQQEETAPVEEAKYTESQYQEIQRQLEEAKQLAQQKSDELIEVNHRYSGFLALGYNKIEDVQNALIKKDDESTGLQRQILSLKEQLVDAAKLFAKNHKEEGTALEIALEHADELKKIKHDYEEVLIALKAEKPDLLHVLGHIDGFRRIVDAAIKILERDNIIKSSDVQKFKEEGSNWIQQIAAFLTVMFVTFGGLAIYFLFEGGWK